MHMRKKNMRNEKYKNREGSIMTKEYDKYVINKDVEAVVTSFNQGSMILEAVHSLCAQTTLPAKVTIVDDGSTDEDSIHVLNRIQSEFDGSIPIVVIKQPNAGVSAARNHGIRETQTSMVLVLDGDDKLEPTYVEQVSQLLKDHPSMIAASSWMHTFGVLDAQIHPCGGDVSAFLSRNCCPATHIMRREVWERCGGYDESMRSGFEDWDFFLSMLETVPETTIGIVEKPLILYRTTPASSNIRSMTKRLELMRFLIEKHHSIYQTHIADAMLGIEAISMSRLYGWESEIINTLNANQKLSKPAEEFLESPSYGDGGMAAAVRIVSSQKNIK